MEYSIHNEVNIINNNSVHSDEEVIAAGADLNVEESQGAVCRMPTKHAKVIPS